MITNTTVYIFECYFPDFSLLAPDLNDKVVSLCIKHRRDMVYNSYLSQDVRDLHKQ